MPDFEYTVFQFVVNTCDVTVEAESEDAADEIMDKRIAEYNAGKEDMMIPDMELFSEEWSLE